MEENVIEFWLLPGTQILLPLELVPVWRAGREELNIFWISDVCDTNKQYSIGKALAIGLLFLIIVSVTFLTAVMRSLKKATWGRKGYFGWQFKGTVHGGEGVAGGLRLQLALCLQTRNTQRDKGWQSAGFFLSPLLLLGSQSLGMAPLTVRVGLPHLSISGDALSMLRDVSPRWSLKLSMKTDHHTERTFL